MFAYKRKTVYLRSHGRLMRMLVFQPTGSRRPPEKTPGVLWIHGGGYSKGFPEMFYYTRARALVQKYGAVMVVPAYRLTGKAPYPAAVNDCYNALRYLYRNSASLGFDPNLLMVGGESAGGGLTAAVCMMARDRGKIKIAFQMPLYPMLDDRETSSSRDNHAKIWNTRRNRKAWKNHLGRLWKTDDIPPYAAPARQTDYTDLPPAYTFVGDLEPFYCETLTYIENLKKAGVPAKADVYHNWYHAYDMFHPFRKKSRIAIAAFEKNFCAAAFGRK